MSIWLTGISDLYKKEIKDSFLSPFVYILAALFIMLTGWIFFSLIVASKEITHLKLDKNDIIVSHFQLFFFH